MDKSKIEKLNPQEYTHLPHAEQHFEEHEQTDVAIRPLVWTLVAIAVIIVVSAVGLWGLFRLFKTVADNQAENKRFSNVEAETRTVPAGFPPLQGIPSRSTHERSPAQDMDQLRKDNVLILAGKKPMREGLPPGEPIDQAIDEALSRKIFKTAPAATQPRQQQAQSR
jgi:hypothetical protein